jgi:hypothetical protein
MVEEIKSMVEKASKLKHVPTVMVMGALGRCGSGAVDFASRCGIERYRLLIQYQVGHE